MTERFAQASVPISRREALRYLGVRDECPDPRLSALLEDCAALLEQAAVYRACRLRTPVSIAGDRVTLGPLTVTSGALSRNLAGCDQALLFAATTGLAVDRLIARFQQPSPLKATVLDALGSAAIEAWCDALCDRWSEECAKEALFLRPRFSPGYGDLSIHVQPPLLELLDARRVVGLTLTDTSLMVPRKSVSAIVGLSAVPCARHRDCTGCTQDCTFRR